MKIRHKRGRRVKEARIHFNYTVFNPEAGLQIHDPGSGHESPMFGKRVTDLEGIVTYEYKIGSDNYFISKHLMN